MRNIYLTNSDEEAIVDFLKDDEDLCNKIHKKFKDKARKDCLWERFANSCNLSVKVTWFKSQRTCYAKLTQSKSVQTPKKMTERQNWIQDKFTFSRPTLQRRASARASDSSNCREEPLLLQPQPRTFHTDQQIHTVWRSTLHPASTL